MKKLILITVITAMAVSTFSQVNSVASIQTENSSLSYMLKAKKQKTAAWICLGSGASLITTAVIIGGSKVTEDIITIYTLGDVPQHNYAGEAVLTVLGAGAMVASIPLFISSSHNKQKAHLTLTEQKTAIGLPVAAPKKITSLTLSISI
jgi:hypothetical protein